MIRKYGKRPFTIAVIHGGPGAAGYIAPVAKELSKNYGIIEPFQSKESVQEQIDELKNQLSSCVDKPITIIGSSWGAMLALLFCAQNQKMVKQLILVGCGTFTKKASEKVDKIRYKRMIIEQKERLQNIRKTIDHLSSQKQNQLMKEFGELFEITDQYEAIPHTKIKQKLSWTIFKKVWNDFVKLRDKPNYINKRFSKIKIPVILIQGDYDPHPTKDVYQFLKKCIPHTKLYELKKCGHYPWIEKYAKDKFYEILKKEINILSSK